MKKNKFRVLEEDKQEQGSSEPANKRIAFSEEHSDDENIQNLIEDKPSRKSSTANENKVEAATEEPAKQPAVPKLNINTWTVNLSVHFNNSRMVNCKKRILSEQAEHQE